MLLSDVLAFAVVAGLVTIVPGLDTAMVLRSALSHGRRQGFATALGVNTGALAWGAGAAVGVSALLEASTVAYTAVRIAGAAYMLWLGSRMLASALRPRSGGGKPGGVPGDDPSDEASDDASDDPSDDPGAARPAPAAGSLQSWRRGLMTNLLNPKIGAFYVAVMPQFIPAHAPHLAVGLLLALVHDAEAMVWFTAIILGAHAARALLRRRSTQRVTDGVTGVALIGFGLKLGLSAR
ncbi:MAG: LysE family translocator [Solirubrobacteraceae bacterium]